MSKQQEEFAFKYMLEEWERGKAYLASKDPRLNEVFCQVDSELGRPETNDSFFPTEEVAKSPFASLVGVVIGQKIRFMKARALRAQVYQHFGTTFSPSAVLDDLEILEDILGPEHRQQYDAISRLCIKAEDCKINPRTAREIQDLCAGIRGIGPWTIAAVLAARLLDWNILPKKDKFLERKLRELPPADFPKDPTTQWAPYCTIATWYLWRWRIQ